MNRVIKVIALASVTMSFAGSASFAADAKVLEGVPSPSEWEDALTPKPGSNSVQFRGLVAGGKPPVRTETANTAYIASPASNAPAAASVIESPRAAARIAFALNSADLQDDAKKVLDNLAAAMNGSKLQTFSFEVVGHTDATGTPEINQVLSEMRARAVVEYLGQAGHVDVSRLKPIGKGTTELADPAHPYDAKNRRVEVITLN